MPQIWRTSSIFWLETSDGFQRFIYCSRRWETTVQLCALPETSVGLRQDYGPWSFITGDLKMKLVGLLFIHIITSSQILAVDTHCANHHTHIGWEAGCASKTVLLTHETAACHHWWSSSAALVSAKGRDDVSRLHANAHLKKSLEEGYRDRTLEVCVWWKKP